MQHSIKLHWTGVAVAAKLQCQGGGFIAKLESFNTATTLCSTKSPDDGDTYTRCSM